MQCDEAELAYLKAAVDAGAADPEMNRLYARALRERGMFDQAIAAWQRVLKAKPDDDEARRANANLQVERTIKKGGYEEAETSTDLMVDKEAQSERMHGTVAISREQQLEKLIAKKPEEIATYLELADLHTREERYPEAEEVLTRALQVSGGDVGIREKVEDAQLRGARQNLRVAEKSAQEEKTPAAVNLYNKMRTELNNLELEVYRSRVERYPSQLGYRFELAVRLKRAGQFKEAIPKFQEASADPKRKAQVHVELGECFQHIKQYPLAMSNYEAAIAAVPDRDIDLRKLSLYRAATLAMGLKDVDKAEKYLTQLASLDFAYRDVADRLEKITALRGEMGGQTSPDSS
jgi:tetratricopeptide (TPR) repeat protein